MAIFSKILHFHYNFFVNYHCLVGPLCDYMLFFEFYLKIEKIRWITIFYFQNYFVIKKETLCLTIFRMNLFIIIFHINWHQVLSSKTPCLVAKQFFPFHWKITTKKHFKKLEAEANIDLCFVKYIWKKILCWLTN